MTTIRHKANVEKKNARAEIRGKTLPGKLGRIAGMPIRGERPASPTNKVAALREKLKLNQPEFARLLPISVRSLATLESGTPPTEVVSRRIVELQRLVNALSEVITKESIGTWLKTPNPAFDGLKPLEVIDRGESDRLWSMIFFLRSGVPS